MPKITSVFPWIHKVCSETQLYSHLPKFDTTKKDLIEKREKIRSLNDETCLKLKKQVYLNYKQFIEAAREISQLESEMFKINHILTEQKGIMDNITKLFSEETFQEAEKRSQEFGLEYFVKGKYSSSFNIEVQFPKNRQKVLKYQKTGNLTKKQKFDTLWGFCRFIVS